MSGPTRDASVAKVGLPPRPFLYTLDQIADMLSFPLDTFKTTHCYFEGRTTAMYQRSKLMCRNMAEMSDAPDWRVPERELIRWMKHKGFRYYSRGYVE